MILCCGIQNALCHHFISNRCTLCLYSLCESYVYADIVALSKDKDNVSYRGLSCPRCSPLVSQLSCQRISNDSSSSEASSKPSDPTLDATEAPRTRSGSSCCCPPAPSPPTPLALLELLYLVDSNGANSPLRLSTCLSAQVIFRSSSVTFANSAAKRLFSLSWTRVPVKDRKKIEHTTLKIKSV